MSGNVEIDRSVEPLKKKKSMAPTGESDKWWVWTRRRIFKFKPVFVHFRIKKSTADIWKFIHHKAIFKTLMSRDYWNEPNKFTIPSNDQIFHNLFIFCLSKSALQNDDGGLQNGTLTDHEQRIKETWEKGEANTVKVGRKCSREHNRARERTVVIQMEVAGAISIERGKWSQFFVYISLWEFLWVFIFSCAKGDCRLLPRLLLLSPTRADTNRRSISRKWKRFEPCQPDDDPGHTTS